MISFIDALDGMARAIEDLKRAFDGMRLAEKSDALRAELEKLVAGLREDAAIRRDLDRRMRRRRPWLPPRPIAWTVALRAFS